MFSKARLIASKGFTLVELLIVVIILAILLALNLGTLSIGVMIAITLLMAFCFMIVYRRVQLHEFPR